MYFYDTETCGLYGVPVIIQYAKDDGPVKIHYIWDRPAEETLELISEMMYEGVCGYNLAFDHFHLQKIYNALDLVPGNTIPIDNVHEMYEAEAAGVYGKCLRPYENIDLMMNVRKSRFQQAMGKHEFVIKKVHLSIVYKTLEYLNRHTNLESYMHINDDAIWFSELIEDESGNWIDREFRNIVGRLKSSSGLKYVCSYLWDLPATHFKEVMPKSEPVELGYIPIAKRIVEMDGWPTKTEPPLLKSDYKGTWPMFIKYYNTHWKEPFAKKYATEDVIWTRRLYEHFDCPTETVDSALTAVIASCKWRGFDLDTHKLEILKQSMIDEINTKIIDSRKAKAYMMEVMSPFEKNRFLKDDKIQGKTGVIALDSIAKWIEICDNCLENDLDGCPSCPPSEVAKRAMEIKKSRKLNSKVKIVKKLLLANRLHPGYNVIGTKSTRLSGAGGLNPQGIDSSDELRECFTLGPNLEGGDFDAFELTICDPVYNDENWREMLRKGEKPYAALASQLYNIPIEQIKEGSPEYKKGKGGQFQMIYGGTAAGMEYKLEVSATQAKRAEKGFFNNFPGFLKRREEIYRDYRPLKEDFSWEEPKETIETFLGHKRYFTLEWNICRILFNLAKSVPFETHDEITVVRSKKGSQTVSNALRSALYQTINSIQKKASRAAINHEIQGAGADITKIVQFAISNLQPRGIHDWKIQTMNSHDEICAVIHDPELVGIVGSIVDAKIEELREKVPFLKMSWGRGPNWKAIH